MLTVKQEKFVQNIIKGMSQREAYKNSYNASKMKDKSCDQKAWELMQKVEIKERYKELLEMTKQEAIMTAIDRKVWLSKVISGEQKEELYVTTDDVAVLVGSRSADLSTKMKAMDILNKMEGNYSTKVELDGDKTLEVKIKVE